MTAKILVVDDSITIQKIVAMAFENEDASVEGIGDGSEALTRLKILHPDIVLADVDMPGLNGFELSRKIKESSELNSIPVMLLASDFEEFNENLFRESLADYHITKPFKSEDLVLNVMELLNGRSQNGAEEETDDVIELSSAHRVDGDVVIELGEDQLMDAHAEFASDEEDEIELDLPNNHHLTGLDEKEATGHDEFAAEVVGEKILSNQRPEEDPPVDIATTIDGPAEMELTDQEESLDELLMKVEELSRKEERTLDNGQELSRMKAIDEMLNEVDALKGEPLVMATDDENNFKDATETRLSPDPTESDAVLPEVLPEGDYGGEENTEMLEATFAETTNGKKYPAVAEENPFPSKEKIMGTGNIEKSNEPQLPQEAQLNQIMETEVRRLLQQSLTPLIEKEISGLFEKIMRTVEENVLKITPGIAKEIIEKEIDEIKSMEDS